eukprot:gene20700-27504_t
MRFYISLLALVFVWLSSACLRNARGAGLDVVNHLHSLWGRIANEAAETSLAAIKASLPPGVPRTLQDVDLETFQVYLGRQHRFTLEVDGQPYDIALGSETVMEMDVALHPNAARGRGQGALPVGQAPAADMAKASQLVPQNWWKMRKNRLSLPAVTLSGPEFVLHFALYVVLNFVLHQYLQAPAADMAKASQLVPQDWWKMRENRLSLPAVTLSGPMELVLSEPSSVSMYTPLAADVGLVRRLLLGTGVTVQLRPVDLPHLPGSYLAEVYAHARLGEAEEGYHFAPGMLSMSQRLHAEAVNASEAKRTPVLSFELEAAGQGSLQVSSVLPSGQSQRLKKEVIAADTTVLTQVSAWPLPHGDMSNWMPDCPYEDKEVVAADPMVVTQVTAWPLPHVDMSNWMPYEDVLRGILANQKLDFDSVLRQGIALRLKQSSIQVGTCEDVLRGILADQKLDFGSVLRRGIALRLKQSSIQKRAFGSVLRQGFDPSLKHSSIQIGMCENVLRGILANQPLDFGSVLQRGTDLSLKQSSIQEGMREDVLRGILANQPLDLGSVLQRGIALRLKQSSIQVGTCEDVLRGILADQKLDFGSALPRGVDLSLKQRSIQVGMFEDVLVGVVLAN